LYFWFFDVIMLFYISLPSWSNIKLYTMVDGERLSVFRVNHWVQKSGHPCYRRLVANTDTHYGLFFLLGAALFYISPQQFVILPSLMPNSIIKYKMAVLFFSPLALYVSYRQKGAGTWLLSCFWVCSSFVPNKILDIVIPYKVNIMPTFRHTHITVDSKQDCLLAQRSELRQGKLFRALLGG
jgi:hypothetical protein